MPNHKDPERVMVYIRKQSHEKLKAVAEAQHRTLGGQVEWMVEEQWRSQVENRAE